MNNLFADANAPVTEPSAPLADRIRPASLEDFLASDELIGENGLISRLSESDPPPSLIFWGPPGCGKTTLARLLSKQMQCHFEALSAVLSGINDVRMMVETAKMRRKMGRRTVLFVDEIHRFNKAQQDAFLPHVENGTIILMGATTENPSFEVIPALLSRCRVVRMNSLSKEQLAQIANRALSDVEKGLGAKHLDISSDALDALCEMSNGDARSMLNILELAASYSKESSCINVEQIKNAVQSRAVFHDKSGDSHYNLISAFHKSLRGSDPDAALHYFWRMIEGGDSPLFLLRRMFNFASEDIGNADPQAMVIVASALSAFELMGVPEGLLPIAHAVIYLATAPKSNAVYKAFSSSKRDVTEKECLPVPDHIINAPTKMMKDMGFGSEYRYPHEYKYHYVAEEYLPKNLAGSVYYEPSEFGFEKELRKRIEFWRKLKQKGHCEREQ